MILHRGKFTIDIYSVKVNMFIVETPEDVQTEINKIILKNKEPKSLIDYDCHGIVFNPDISPLDFYVMYAKQDLSYNTVTHETDHLRNYIIDYLNLHETTEEKECSANLNGLINQKVFSFLSKKKIKINAD